MRTNFPVTQQLLTDEVSQVQRVDDLVVEIKAASKEQSLGISQVSQAVSQINEMTQLNAAMLEESSATANSLSDQVRCLAEAVRVFSV